MEERLIEFISREMGISKAKIHLDSSLVEDFGIVGKDGEFLLKRFEEVFSTDVSSLVASDYFGEEGGANPLALFVRKLRPKLAPLLVRDLLNLIEGKQIKGS